MSDNDFGFLNEEQIENFVMNLQEDIATWQPKLNQVELEAAVVSCIDRVLLSINYGRAN